MRAAPLVGAVLSLAILAGCTDAAPDRTLSVELSAGASHEVGGTAERRITSAEADFAFDNVGNAKAKVRVSLFDPTGLLVAFRDATAEPGAHADVAARRGYAGTGGAPGDYRGRIEVMEGSIRLTEGAVDFDEGPDEP